MTTHRRTRSRWTGVAVATIVLVGASLLPVPFDRRRSFEGFGPDTVLHFLGYAGFAAILAEALDADGIEGASRGALTVGTATGIAIGTGRLQRSVPGRDHERSDVVAGVLGACIGVLLGTVGLATDRSERTEPSPSAGDERGEAERGRPNQPS